MPPKQRSKPAATIGSSKRRLKAPPKPRPPKVQEGSKAARFRARGPFKCVVGEDGRGMKGLHRLLEKVCGLFDYKKAKKDGTLAVVPDSMILPPSCTVPIPHCVRKARRMPYGSKEGIKLDNQLGQVVKLHQTHHIPLDVFCDPDKRKLFFLRGSSAGFPHPCRPPSESVKKSITSVAGRLLPETMQVLHWLHTTGFQVIATQVVAEKAGVVGTCLDMVVRNSTGERVVLEFKTGCQKVWTHNKPMVAPWFRKVIFTTQREHLFQTLIGGRLDQDKTPGEKHGAPLLVRVDTVGLHIYHIPEWMRSREQPLSRWLGL